MADSTFPTMDVDLYSRDVLVDPWPILSRIREAGPLVWNERGFWMTARDRVCRQIYNRPDQIGQEGMITAFFGSEAFISIDERSRHAALRNVWVSAFSHQAVAALVAFVRKVAQDMLDAVEPELRSGAAVDLMARLCRPLPAHVIAHMLGVADDMLARVIKWSDLMGDAASGGFPIDYDNDPAWLAGEQAKKDLAAYLIDQFHYRRQTRGDDLISQIVHSDVGKTLSEEAMMVNTRQLLFAGNETTAKWLGHILLTFGNRPDVRQAVAEDRSLLPGALEEVMRLENVTQVTPRGVNRDDVVVEGIALPRGAEVLMLIGAANRDPERYANPDELDIRRDPQPHLGFGFGLHSCLGAVLARMEAREVAAAVLDRFPDFEIAQPVQYGNFNLRGPNEVWVELERV